MARYPKVELEISLSDRVVDLVEEGYDLAIRISRGGSQTHVARKLAASRNIVCAAPDYLDAHGTPATPDELATHRCLAYSYTAMAEDWRLTHQDGREAIVRMRPVMYSNNGDTARAAALAGQGVIWQPTFLIGEDLKTGRLKRLLPDWNLPDIDILAVYPSRRHLSAKVRLMVDFLAEAFKGIAPWDR